ncbi:MAG: hypothetical protein ABSA30_00990 [Candidatus Aminicenantales bacterium]|jgi:hypothetical protein
MTRAAVLILLPAAALAFLAGAACKKTDAPISPADKAAAEAKAIEDEAAAAAEEANKPAPKPEPKMNDTLYIEITARFVLLQEKYKDEPEKADPEMDKVYDTLGVTPAEYREFKKALTPGKKDELTRKVQDKMQVLEREYK